MSGHAKDAEGLVVGASAAGDDAAVHAVINPIAVAMRTASRARVIIDRIIGHSRVLGQGPGG
jgi:hypothetical protein